MFPGEGAVGPERQRRRGRGQVRGEDGPPPAGAQQVEPFVDRHGVEPFEHSGEAVGALAPGRRAVKHRQHQRRVRQARAAEHRRQCVAERLVFPRHPQADPHHHRHGLPLLPAVPLLQQVDSPPGQPDQHRRGHAALGVRVDQERLDQGVELLVTERFGRDRAGDVPCRGAAVQTERIEQPRRVGVPRRPQRGGADDVRHLVRHRQVERAGGGTLERGEHRLPPVLRKRLGVVAVRRQRPRPEAVRRREGDGAAEQVVEVHRGKVAPPRHGCGSLRNRQHRAPDGEDVVGGEVGGSRGCRSAG